MLRGERSLVTTIEKCFLRRNGAPSYLNEKCLLLAIVYFLLLLLVGASAHVKTQNWSYGESLYFFAITFTTVGFGDFVPQKLEEKYITVPLILLGLASISNLLHAAAALTLIKRVTAGSQERENEEAAV